MQSSSDAKLPEPPRTLTPEPEKPSLQSFHVGQNLSSLRDFLDGRLKGIPTPWAAVNKTLNGLGGLVVLQGAPGSNKSTAALQIATFNAATYGRPALVVDEENGRDRVRTRMLCQLNGRSELQLQELKIRNPGAFAELERGLSALPLHVASGAVPGPHCLDALASELMAGAKDYGFLVVDSIQALPRIAEDERQNLESWMKHLDRLKLKYNGKLVVVATSEKNYSTFDEASLKGGKGSSSIGYKGELVLDFRSLSPGVVRMEVVKNRDGFKGAAWDMELALAERANPASFTFQLAPRGELPG